MRPYAARLGLGLANLASIAEPYPTVAVAVDDSRSR